MQRSSSYVRKYSEDVEDLMNVNVLWMKDAFAWVFYPCFVIGICAVAMLTGMSLPQAVATTHLIHGSGTFILLHWIKGSPNFYGQNVQAGLTLWEQLEPHSEWVNAKRYLTLLPTILLLATLMTNGYAPQSTALHVPMYIILVVAKLPVMHRVRLFGLNSTPGIDDDDEHEGDQKSARKRK